ncbi:uncharacterized protein LOC107361472 [Tetranychus urticae]|uniref:uncharacterized protein LOC107361472 n=1 Tax=Tetranychus urticae TaxID=32264 RepID=UPI00077B9A45|nr:uncharacterized protein LOC107361472 [Tetranychus urticae]
MDIDSDDRLTIVNRTLIYNVSKKLICSSVPYFEKMFCCDLLESKENKVVLDFDEHAFDAILNWIHTGLFTIRMDSVISLYESADYLMINERLLQPCLSYFHENFTIEFLPVILPQVTKVSKLINSGAIESFICRHFLKIVNTSVFLNYPVETVEEIIKLELMVYSELQIFEAIMKWVNKNAEQRKEFLCRLLKFVRWSFIDSVDISKIKEDKLIKTLENLDSIICSGGQYGSDRSKQSFFISVHEKKDRNLRIRIFDSRFLCLPIGDFTQDDSIPLEFVHGEHISDILFDSGRRGIRIDWIKKTFRWLHSTGEGKTFHHQIYQLVIKFLTEPNYSDCYLMDKDTELPHKVPGDECMLLESNYQFILIGKAEEKFFGIFEVARCWFITNYLEMDYTFIATVLDNHVYILTRDIEFIKFSFDTGTFKKSEPFKERKLCFEELILTSHHANDDRIILLDKSSGKIYCFNITNESWTEMCQIMNLNFDSTSVVDSNKLIAFTSTFLPINSIKPQFERKFL